MTQNLSAVPDAAPVSQQERIVILDSLRGIALLGILLMNIPYFALPVPGVDNLAVNNEIGTINGKAWYGINWFMEGTQRAIFSMLFGAGIILFITRLEKRIDGLMTAEYFMRRQLWLVVFGLINAFVFLWPGDILFEYGIIGTIAFAFRRLSVKYLLLTAFICMLLMTARENLDLVRQKAMITKGEAIARLDTSAIKLTDLQREELGAMTAFKESASIEGQRKQNEKSLREVRGSYALVYHHLSNVSTHWQFIHTYYGLWDILTFLFIGMAFYKNGILTGSASSRTYWLLFIGGMGAGLIISYFRLQPLFDTRFNSFDYVKKIPFEYYEISRTFRSLGLFGFIMLLYKSGWFNWLFKLMQPVGQMAFTNYLTQSFICALYFYGFGFAMYGQLQRYEVYYVLATIWVVQIAWSHLWLRYFRFGPLEWLWRSLTYWHKQPMKKPTLLSSLQKKISLTT